MLRTYLIVHGYVYVLVSVCFAVVLYLWLAFKLIVNSRRPTKRTKEWRNFEEACQTTLSTVPYFFCLLLTGQLKKLVVLIIIQVCKDIKFRKAFCDYHSFYSFGLY